jgi:N-acyl-D-aspartate/D-glutamate deacylase
MLDRIIKGGQVVDGTGAPAFTADVGVKDGRIVAVGKLADAARETIDADGLTVAPGWVDIHTHYDGQVTWDHRLEPSAEHGVTTALFGNCGVGFAPARPDRREWLINLMEGVEDIPGSALAEGIVWEWETFPEYLDALSRRSYALDVGASLAHGAVRAYVMGDRGARNEAATGQDIAEMARLVREAQDAGGFGLSTSRTIVHRAVDGEPVPGTFAAIDELRAMAGAIGESGHGLLEWAPAGVTGEDIVEPPKEMARMREISLAAGCPISFLCFQVNSQPDFWREQLAECERVQAQGGRLSAQVSPRTAGMIASLRSRLHPFAQAPAWAALEALPFAERIKRLQADAELRRAVAEQGGDNLTGKPQGLGFSSWGRTYPLSGVLDYEPSDADSIAGVAAREGRDPRAVALDLMLQRDGEAFLLSHLLNYSYGDLSAAYDMLRAPHTVAAGSDGGAHVGVIVDVGLPTFLLTHWRRDRTRGPRLPLELLVRKQTADTAALYGLKDRGRLLPGLRADLNLIDLDNLRLKEPELVNDLPTGAQRLRQGVDGYMATLVAGEVTQSRGQDTGARPGRLVRSRACA